MFEKIINEIKSLNPNLIFNKVDHPMGGSYVDVVGGKSVPLKAILILPEGWWFKEDRDNVITDGGDWSLHLVPLP